MFTDLQNTTKKQRYMTVYQVLKEQKSMPATAQELGVTVQRVSQIICTCLDEGWVKPKAVRKFGVRHEPNIKRRVLRKQKAVAATAATTDEQAA